MPIMQKSGPAVLSDRAEPSPRGTGAGVEFHGSPASIEPDFSIAAKRFRTLQARLALVGWTLTETAGAYVAGRWGMSRPLADLGAVEAFAQQVGAPA